MLRGGERAWGDADVACADGGCAGAPTALIVLRCPVAVTRPLAAAVHLLLPFGATHLLLYNNTFS